MAEDIKIIHKEPCELWAWSITLSTIGAQQRALNRSKKWNSEICVVEVLLTSTVENLESVSPIR